MFQKMQRTNRSGSTYITVLGSSMIVSLLALSAMLGHRIHNRRLQGEGDLERARLGAQAALKIAMLRIGSDPDWRYKFPHGIWEVKQHLTANGDNTLFTIQGTDPQDGDLTDDPEDHVVLIGMGSTGIVQQKIQVTLAPAIRGLNCMESAMHAGDGIQFLRATVHSDAMVSSNTNVNADDSSIHANVEATEAISGSNFEAGQNSGVETRQMPNPTKVFEYYLDHGTTIDINDIVAPKVPLVSKAPNLLTNSDFEDGLFPWKPLTSSTCEIELSGSKVFHGSESLCVKNRSNHQAGPLQDVSDVIEDGTIYESEVYVYMKEKDAYTRLVIDVTTSGGESSTWATDAVYCRENQWVRVSGMIQPSFIGQVGSATFRIETRETPKSGEDDAPGEFFVDQFILRRQSEAVGDNIFTDGDMEGWTAQESTTTWIKKLGAMNVHSSTVQAHGGSKSTYVGSRFSPFAGAGQFVTNELQNGVEYEVRVWARKKSSGTIQLRPVLIYKDGNGPGKLLYHSDFTSVTHGEWTEVVQRLTPQWEGTLKYAFLMWWTKSSNHSYYIDDAVLCSVAPPAPPTRTIYRQVLSPHNNPYGSGVTNPQGIYVIDCQQQEIHVERSRIVGTLVLLNPASNSSIRPGPISWQTAVPNFPALLVSGDFNIQMDAQGLSESEQLTNFNPPGTPFAGLTLTEDEDLNDTYRSKVDGLIYVTGSLQSGHHVTINGLLISGGRMTATGHLDLRYNRSPSTNPPPGFNSPEQIRLLQDSVIKIVDSDAIAPPLSSRASF